MRNKTNKQENHGSVVYSILHLTNTKDFVKHVSVIEKQLAFSLTSILGHIYRVSRLDIFFDVDEKQNQEKALCALASQRAKFFVIQKQFSLGRARNAKVRLL